MDVPESLLDQTLRCFFILLSADFRASKCFLTMSCHLDLNVMGMSVAGSSLQQESPSLCLREASVCMIFSLDLSGKLLRLSSGKASSSRCRWSVIHLETKSVLSRSVFTYLGLYSIRSKLTHWLDLGFDLNITSFSGSSKSHEPIEETDCFFLGMYGLLQFRTRSDWATELLSSLRTLSAPSSTRVFWICSMFA